MKNYSAHTVTIGKTKFLPGEEKQVDQKTFEEIKKSPMYACFVNPKIVESERKRREILGDDYI